TVYFTGPRVVVVVAAVGRGVFELAERERAPFLPSPPPPPTTNSRDVATMNAIRKARTTPVGRRRRSELVSEPSIPPWSRHLPEVGWSGPKDQGPRRAASPEIGGFGLPQGVAVERQTRSRRQQSRHPLELGVEPRRGRAVDREGLTERVGDFVAR